MTPGLLLDFPHLIIPTILLLSFLLSHCTKMGQYEMASVITLDSVLESSVFLIPHSCTFKLYQTLRTMSPLRVMSHPLSLLS